MNHVIAILLESLVLLSWILLLFCVVVGALFLLLPETARKLTTRFSQMMTLRRAMRPLEIPRNTDQFFYRHHRWVGAALILLASVFLYIYLTGAPATKISQWIGRQIGTQALDTTWLWLSGFVAVVNFAALLMGAVLLVRPSSLKPVEAVANRWISTRKALRGAEASHDELDRMVWRMPRLFGLLVLVGACYIGFNLLILLNKN